MTHKCSTTKIIRTETEIKKKQEQQQPVCRVARYSTWEQYNKEETKQKKRKQNIIK